MIVLAIRAEKGRRALVGAVYGADGTALPRTPDIALEPIEPSPKRLRAMAAYLAGDIDRIPDDPLPAGRSRGRASQALLGIGALAAVGSSVWYLASPDDDHTMPTYEGRKAPVAVFFGSSLALGAGVYLYLRTSRTGAVTAAVLSAGVTALLSGAMLYAIDEDPYSGPGTLRYHHRDTAPAGLILGGAGVALTGAGIWLLRRDPRGRSMPIASAARTCGFLGWSTSF